MSGDRMSPKSAGHVGRALVGAAGLLFTWLLALPAFAQEHMGTMPSTMGTGGTMPAPVHHGGEAALIVPRLDDPSVASFFGGTAGSTLLTAASSSAWSECSSRS